jgi:uncharacterized protein YkwD
MNKKYLPLLVVAFGIGLFSITAKPKAVVSSEAMTLNDSFSFPSIRPFPTFSFYRDSNTISWTNTPKPSATSTTTSAPAATAKPTTTQQPVQTISGSYEDQVFTLVNNERAKVNLPALTKNDALAKSAESYALRMGQYNFFSHTGNDGSTYITRNTSAGYTGYRWMGENIAAGQQTPSDVMNDWMHSDGHRKNILNSNAKEIGVGYEQVSGSKYGKYWVQEFGAK